MTTHAEESSDRLTCKFINHIEGTWTVGCSCVVAKIKEIEAIATPEVKEKMRELLAEMSVLVAISNIKDVTTPEEQVYHCSECGHEFHKHDVFYPNPECGKLITYMDYQE